MLDEPELDPVACPRGYLNAVVSLHPYDLKGRTVICRFHESRSGIGTGAVAGPRRYNRSADMR